IIGLSHALVLFVVGLVIIHRFRRPKLNEPPLVPYKYPFVGHSFEFKRNPEEFIKQCHKKYGDIFSFYASRQIYTVVSNDLVYELFRSSDFSFRSVSDVGSTIAQAFIVIALRYLFTSLVNQRFPFYDIIGSTLYPDFTDNLSAMLKDSLYGHLADYQTRIYRELRNGIDQLIGDCKEAKVINNPEYIIRIIIARTVANVVVGETLCRDPEVVETFATFATVLVQSRKLSDFAYFIHPSVHRKYAKLIFNCGDNPVQKHKDLLIRKLKFVFEKHHQRDRQQHGNEWTCAVNDLIDRIINHSLELFGQVQYDYIACYLLSLILAGIHTVSANVLNTLNDFAGRPEYWEDLREEQEFIAGDVESDLSVRQVNEMKKLDSFVKESTRLVGHVLAFSHRVMSSSYTFKNGYQVPKDRLVFVNHLAYMSDPSLHGDNPETFSGFRYVEKIHLPRLIAMAILIRKYEISSLDGKRPKNIIGYGGIIIASAPLKFKSR
ncbi:1705_t:CDS:10, partial [Paraglomus occultum]